MRFLMLPAMLALTASCAVPPPAEGPAPAPRPFVVQSPLEWLFGPPPAAAAAPGAPVALVTPAPPPAPPPPVVLATAPPPAAPAPAIPIAAVLNFLPFAEFFTPLSGRVTLSNFSFDTAQIQAVVTPYPDCLPHEGVVATDFALPLNGTRIINTPPGSDVCWRRAVGPDSKPGGAPDEPGWTEWNRDFTSTGAFIDARL